MYIKSYSCKRFAGIKDKELDFEKGLNVILGPNESGKSTIIDGIHSTLFKNIKLKRNNNPDLNFMKRYMPSPDGDSIDGNITISIDGEEFQIYREWGVDEKIYLINPDGSIIKSEDTIDDKLGELFQFGQGTYTNIVFAKQRDLKAAITNLVQDKEATNEINSLLRNTIMELDGISIDHLEQKIHDQLEHLLKRWDLEKNYPENNKGINNPYKTGLGKILQLFYAKEQLKLQMSEANRSESKFEEICKLILENDNMIMDSKAKKEELETIEEDVNTRVRLELELKIIEDKLETLTEINKEWPRANLLLEQYKEELENIQREKEKLDMELKNFELFKEKQDLDLKLEKANNINKDILEIKEAIEKIPHITKEDVQSISNIEREILTLETSMAAGIMILKLIKFDFDGDIYISKDLDEKQILEKNVELKANGFVNIEYEDKFKLEIKTGELDFEELKTSHKELVENHKKSLENLSIESLEQGKLNREKLEDLINEEKNLNKEIRLYLGESTLEELAHKIDLMGDISNSREKIEIEEDIKILSTDEMKLGIEKKTLENKIGQWVEKYTDGDNLLDLLLEGRAELKSKNKVLDTLVPLPEEFSDGEDFKNTLREIKEIYNKSTEKQMELKSEYYEAQGQLLDISYEELKVLYEQTESEFNKNIAKANSLLRIKEVFQETKEELGSNPMESLVREFSRVLSIITSGDYDLGQIDENFEIKLESETRGVMDIDLLSAGTYDAVTLALRFSILKHIYGERNGYVCLDDCLVDLDPERKQQSINIIKDFAKDNQVIFTTCDPQTADLLGGNIIKI